MSTNRLVLENALTSEEYSQIDHFCMENKEVRSLPQLSKFLEQLGVKLVIDMGIVSGFVTDSSNLPGSASAVARPANERECAAILRACFQAEIPVTVSAGRSNLTGSATPHGGVVINTAKMLTPEVKVNETSMTVVSPVGIILEDLRTQVLEQTQNRLIFSVNPTSRADAAIGGALACNASGFSPGEVGAFRNWVESLDFLFPNGKKLSATRNQYVSEDGKFIIVDDGKESDFMVPTYSRPNMKNASGPYSNPAGRMDFIDLVVGSEGIFGLATACQLKVERRPSEYLDIFFSLPSETNAIACHQYIHDNLEGGEESLTALEYFGVNCRTYMKHDDKLFNGDDQVAIYVQVPLYDKSLDDAAAEWYEFLTQMPEACGISEDAIMLLTNDREREMFMESRHSMPANAVEVVQRRGTYTIMTDAIVPPDKFSEYLDYVHGTIRAEGLDYLAFGHLGDCHLHFTILPEKETLENATKIYNGIIDKASDLGGVYSAEHGTGKRKRADFFKCYGPEGVNQIKRAKSTVDPHFLINRDNVIEYVQ
ncbi:MAG: FAD-binding oxidoreductase [Candidatus Competibacteraceae bacterium]|jgi:D-lactate dehydrogenase (cytochrome)|nr:FAD-binding oxidoreductase [Candidatus Competibacteraceae bacterium]